MTREVRREIEELLKDFGRTGEPELRIPRPEAREDGANRRPGGAQDRVPGSSGPRVVEIHERSSRHKKGKPWSRVQRRSWQETMEEAGCRLPFPEDRESVQQILAYVLGRLVARKMRPPQAEAVVHVCKLMLRI